MGRTTSPLFLRLALAAALLLAVAAALVRAGSWQPAPFGGPAGVASESRDPAARQDGVDDWWHRLVDR